MIFHQKYEYLCINRKINIQILLSLLSMINIYVFDSKERPYFSRENRRKKLIFLLANYMAS